MLPSPRLVVLLLVVATAWVAPVLWTLFAREREAVGFFSAAECTVTRTRVTALHELGTVRYVGVWDVYWYELQPDPCPTPDPRPPTLCCCCRTDSERQMWSGQIYGRRGDGSLMFSLATEAQARNETSSPATGETAPCSYDVRMRAEGRQVAHPPRGWVRWGSADSSALLGGCATAASVAWLCLAACVLWLRRLERRHECTTGLEQWGVGVLCCAQHRAEERQILMDDLGDDEEDDGGGAGGGAVSRTTAVSSRAAAGSGGEDQGEGKKLLGGTR